VANSSSILVALVAALAACAGDPEPVDPCAFEAAGSPWLAFASAAGGSYDIWVARADGSCPRPVTTDPSTDLSPSWSGPRIAFASDRAGAASIWIVDLVGGTEGRLDTGLLGAAAPAFSPDGNTVAFEGRPAGAPTVDVYRVPRDGGIPIALTSHPADDTAPAWSPDGSTVYFVSTRTGAYEVFAVPSSGGEATQVTSGSRIIGKPSVSPDGAALYFARRMGSSSTEVVRFTLGTGAATVVSGADESEPAVSPDGTRLALRSFRYDASNADVIAVDATDGGRPARLTLDPAPEGSPAWAPGPIR
jgi:TolB protein